MSKTILKLENVGYRYSDAAPDDYVFRDINLEVKEGEIFAIVGPSGCGKSTLLYTISGLEECTEGKIYFEGKDLSKINKDVYRSNHIAIIFQNFNLLNHLTVRENIELSMNLSKTKVKNKKETIAKVLKSVNLDPEAHADKMVLKLSGGQQQRTAIARSLSYDSKMIIADEPTANLDPDTQRDVINIFQRLAREEKKCIVIVTHSEEVAKMADKVFKLQPKI